MINDELLNASDEVTLIKAYRQAFIKNDVPAINTIFRHKHILKHFHFLGVACDDIILNYGITALPLLVDELLALSFDQILKKIFMTDNCKKHKRRFSKAVKRFGTIFINNIFILSKIIDVNKNLDLIIRMDHINEIPQIFLKHISTGDNYLQKLLKSYPTTRAFLLLLTYTKESHDIVKMIDFLHSHLGQCFIDDMKKYCGKKPKSFLEIHNNVLTSYMSFTFFPRIDVGHDYDLNKELNQEVLFLDGEKLCEFTISVPKTVGDLRLAGKTLHHCVGLYDSDVIQKSSQIINLTLNGQLMFSLELKMINCNYQVVQFKGYKNSAEYEDDVGLEYRRFLENRLRSHTYDFHRYSGNFLA
jgi:hypothetical protein